MSHAPYTEGDGPPAAARGPAIVLEESGNAAFADGGAPTGISVHVLPRPLEMRRVFRVVADALGTG